MVIIRMGQGVALHGSHLGAAVGQNDQCLFPIGKGPVHQCGKSPAHPLRKDSLGLAVRAGAFAVGVHPGQIIRVVLHLNEIAALKAAEAHLLQVLHLHEPCTREEHLSGLPGAAERGNIDRFRPEIRPPQLGAARRAQGDIPLALIALFGVVGRQALAAEAEDLEKLAEELSAYDIVMATEVGGGVVPMDTGERAAREAAGRLACLLAARAGCVVQMFCGIPTVLKGELPPC